MTIAISSQVLGIVLGVLGALGRISRHRVFEWPANFYVWIFRGTPLLVQIMIIYFGLLNTNLFRWDDVNIGGFVIEGKILAGITALALNEGAYMTEIVRAGIMAVDTGQMEASRSLGMTYVKAMRRIVLPQAARVIVPPLGNEFNNMLKTTSLLVIISVQELFVTFQILNGNGPTSFHPFELFLACAVLVPAADDDMGRHPGSHRAPPREGHAGCDRRWTFMGSPRIRLRSAVTDAR